MSTGSDQDNMDLEHVVHKLKKEHEEREKAVEDMLNETINVSMVIQKVENLSLEKKQMIDTLNQCLSPKTATVGSSR